MSQKCRHYYKCGYYSREGPIWRKKLHSKFKLFKSYFFLHFHTLKVFALVKILCNLSKSHFHWFEKRQTPKLINCYVPPSINTKSDHQLEKWLWPISSDNSTTPQDDRVPRIVQKLFFLFQYYSIFFLSQ